MITNLLLHTCSRNVIQPVLHFPNAGVLPLKETATIPWLPLTCSTGVRLWETAGDSATMLFGDEPKGRVHKVLMRRTKTGR